VAHSLEVASRSKRLIRNSTTRLIFRLLGLARSRVSLLCLVVSPLFFILPVFASLESTRGIISVSLYQMPSGLNPNHSYTIISTPFQREGFHPGRRVLKRIMRAISTHLSFAWYQNARTKAYSPDSQVKCISDK